MGLFKIKYNRRSGKQTVIFFIVLVKSHLQGRLLSLSNLLSGVCSDYFLVHYLLFYQQDLRGFYWASAVANTFMVAGT